VLCNEQWQAVDENAQILTKTSKHAWLSSRPLNRYNVHERCNLAARYRWGIESCILVEKHQGYAYEHAFAKDWNAMRGYHYLMRIAHLLNTLARFSTALAPLFKKMGIQAFIRFLRTTYTGPWLDNAADIEQRMRQPFRLRFLRPDSTPAPIPCTAGGALLFAPSANSSVPRPHRATQAPQPAPDPADSRRHPTQSCYISLA